MRNAQKQMGRLFALALAVALACFALVGCGNSETPSSSSEPSSSSSTIAADANMYRLIKPGTVVVGSDLDYEPMEYLDGDTPTGFGVAMMQEVAKRLGLECEFLPPQHFDSLIEQVASATKMDIAVSSITITPERAQFVDFSDPYYESNLAVVVPKDAKVDEFDDFSGRTIGVQQGTSGEDWVKKNAAAAALSSLDTVTDVMEALRSGKVDAAVYDAPVAESLVTGEFADEAKVLELIPTGEQYGIAVNVNNAQLTEDINKALAQMEEDGTMEALKAQYIG